MSLRSNHLELQRSIIESFADLSDQIYAGEREIADGQQQIDKLLSLFNKQASENEIEPLLEQL